jgi:exodeoxyribonuclease VII large subunit
VIQRRFANVRILISPVRVQGETAAREVAEAIDGFNARADVDVIIVTRGGGSLEDLWAFNEEAVARAIARSRIPVISAVGHEIDFTISDFVADLRVPTPSAAAELVIAAKSELQGKIETLSSKFSSAISGRISSLRNRLRLCEQSYVFQAPRNMVRQHQQLLDELESRLQRSFQHKIVLIRNLLGAVAGKLESLSPLAILARGYSVIMREKDGAVVSAAAQVTHGDIVRARLHRGGFTASVREIVDTTP